MGRSQIAESRDTPLSSRGERRQRTRQALLRAGRALFAERGPTDVTCHAIAAEAGFAAGTFYLHFKDKLALFRELAEEAAGQLESGLEAADLEGESPFDTLHRQAEVLVDFATRERDLLRILFHPGDEVAPVRTRILERLADRVREKRREQRALGEATECLDDDLLAQAVVGLWAHVLAWWAEEPARASRAAIVETLTHFQVHGIRVEGCESGR